MHDEYSAEGSMDEVKFVSEGYRYLPVAHHTAKTMLENDSYFVHEIPTPEQTATLLGSYGEPPEDTEKAHRFGARSAPYPRQLGRGYLAKNSDAAPGGSGSAK